MIATGFAVVIIVGLMLYALIIIVSRTLVGGMESFDSLNGNSHQYGTTGVYGPSIKEIKKDVRKDDDVPENFKFFSSPSDNYKLITFNKKVKNTQDIATFGKVFYKDAENPYPIANVGYKDLTFCWIEGDKNYLIFQHHDKAENSYFSALCLENGSLIGDLPQPKIKPTFIDFVLSPDKRRMVAVSTSPYSGSTNHFYIDLYFYKISYESGLHLEITDYMLDVDCSAISWADENSVNIKMMTKYNKFHHKYAIELTKDERSGPGGGHWHQSTDVMVNAVFDIWEKRIVRANPVGGEVWN
jgi:hypothetical protein